MRALNGLCCWAVWFCMCMSVCVHVRVCVCTAWIQTCQCRLKACKASRAYLARTKENFLLKECVAQTMLLLYSLDDGLEKLFTSWPSLFFSLCWLMPPDLKERIAVAESRVHAAMLTSRLGVVVDRLGKLLKVLASSLVIVVDCLWLKALIRVAHGRASGKNILALVSLAIAATHFEDCLGLILFVLCLCLCVCFVSKDILVSCYAVGYAVVVVCSYECCSAKRFRV